MMNLMREEFSKRFDEVEIKVRRDMNEIRERVDKLERKEYDTDRTIVFTKLPPISGQSDLDVVRDALYKGGVQEASVRNVKRVGKGVGVVVCELETVQEKIQCLMDRKLFHIQKKSFHFH